MREIILDTETTGLDPENGDRIVEIGCLELINRLPSGKTFHAYINPQRSMSPEAQAVHGLSDLFLADKPVFKAVADDFLGFIDEDALVIHNAAFDMKFLNVELVLASRDRIDKNPVIDTLAMARKKFPGAPASLNALCRRFQIDNSGRDLHGALLDSELLAGVYLELSGGRQPDLVFQARNARSGPDITLQADGAPQTNGRVNTTGLGQMGADDGSFPRQPQSRRQTLLPPRLSADERAAHRDFLHDLPQCAMWLDDKEDGETANKIITETITGPGDISETR